MKKTTCVYENGLLIRKTVSTLEAYCGKCREKTQHTYKDSFYHCDRCGTKNINV